MVTRCCFTPWVLLLIWFRQCQIGSRTTMENRERTCEGGTPIDDIGSRCSSLVNILRGKCRALRPLHKNWCMYRVPEKIRALNEKAYAPLVISIGPYHHGTVNNQEDLKLRFVQTFLQWTEKTLEDLVNFVMEREEGVRSFYDEETLSPNFPRNNNAFAEMILMDAVFVVVLLLKWFASGFWEEDDDLYRLTNMLPDVQRDLALLENQLPLFILEELFNVVKIARGLSISFCAAALAFWNVSILSKYTIPPEIEIPGSSHFVDMLRLYHAPTEPMQQPKADSNWGLVYPRSLTELHEAGIRLVKRSTSTKFTDIRYKNGILEIPHIAIADWTESYLRNMVAFEQCHCIEDRYMTDYISLMDRLVNTPKDVELLIQNEILDNWLGDNNQVCDLFNNLKKNVKFLFGHFYYTRLCEDLDAYCKVRRHKWKANLRQNYFRNPWTSISVAAAALLLVLTVLQTVASFMQVYSFK